MDARIYLSELILDPRARRSALLLRDVQAMHEMVALCQGPDNTEGRSVLYAVDYRRSRVRVQTIGRPDWSRLGGQTEVRGVKEISGFLSSFQPGEEVLFHLAASPLLHLESRPDGRRGRKVPMLRDEDRDAWLTRKLKPAGEPAGALWISERRLTGRGRGGHRITITQSVFTGLLRVRDPHSLYQLAVTGIGSAKAYGSGLLTMARSGV